MRNKFFHILFLIALLQFTACRHDEIDDLVVPREICFASIVPEQQLARASETLPEDYSMWVAAIYHAQDNASHSYYFNPTEREFTWDDSNDVWGAAVPDLYYPFSGSIDFLAYAFSDPNNIGCKPTASFAPAALTSANPTFTGVNLDFSSKLDGTVPVVFSDIRSSACPCGSQIPALKFRNSQAKLVFTARTTDSNAASRLKIYNLTITNVKTSGVLSVSALPTSMIDDVETGSIAAWQLPLSGASHDVSLLSGSQPIAPAYVSDLQAAGKQIGQPIYLPAQSSSPFSVRLALQYSIVNLTQTFGPQTVYIDLDNVTWNMGSQYNYMLTLSLTEISVQCASVGAIVDYNPVEININEIYEGRTLPKSTFQYSDSISQE